MTTVHRHQLDLLERLGGTDADVHRAVDRRTGRVVVVKHAPWDRPGATARLGREAAILARVRHPSLVRSHGQVDDGAGRHLVLAHAPGGSFADELAAGRRLAAVDTADAGARLAGALAALHRAGVVHRDVHPGNVVLDAELQPVLVDLDLALDETGEALPPDREVVGHPDHVDHRLFAGRPPAAASDLHALATTLWTICTGAAPPRSGPSGAVTLPDHPAVPGPLHDVLRACVEHRAGDAAAVAAALAAVHTSLRTHAPLDERRPPTGPTPAPSVARGTHRWGPPPPPTPAAHAGSAPGRHRLGIAVPVAVAAVLLTIAGWLLRSTPSPSVGATDCGRRGTSAAAVLADLDGDGCPEELTLTDGVLRSPSGDYRLGQPDDMLVAGDWDGDGRVGIGLYRPSTGVVLLIDDPGPGARSRPAEQHATHGTPRVVTGPAGDRVHVDPP